ncbi:MAG: ferredoxin reductase [Alcanivoracaceae bacterium]|nr:ferredoxin reductase [Alcanivoracaceae bacterium]
MVASTVKKLLRAGDWLATPLNAARYLETINPLWSDHGRGRVERLIQETPDTVTLVIRANGAWAGGEAGQYVQLGLDIDGVRYWRCYSLASPVQPGSREFSVTVNRLDGGRVSTYINDCLRAGDLVHLKATAGDFVLPAQRDDQKLLFISAGSGVTPVMGMLRQLIAERSGADVVMLHFSPDYAHCIFHDELRASNSEQRRIHLAVTREDARDGDLAGHFSADMLEQVCPDWRSRQAYVCGPSSLMSAVSELFLGAGLSSQLKQEAFVLKRAEVPEGAGGKVGFVVAGKQVDADGKTSLLEVAEGAGLTPEHGCRMGICCGCLATLKEGQVRDLNTGEVFGESGEKVRICVCAAAGDVSLEL